MKARPLSKTDLDHVQAIVIRHELIKENKGTSTLNVRSTVVALIECHTLVCELDLHSLRHAPANMLEDEIDGILANYNETEQCFENGFEPMFASIETEVA